MSKNGIAEGPANSFIQASLAADSDRIETNEWLDSLDSVRAAGGLDRCKELLRRLFDHARSLGVEVSTLLNTPYCNTIAPADETPFPGDLELERRITAIVRWNALAMVVRANRESTELGGHLASYASAAELFEVGFNHFFHGDALDAAQVRTADLVFFQPHSAPGVYARAFLEGRLTEENLANYRREVGGKGLSSYPHPMLMPDFWQFPTGSMGLGAITAIYQARFIRYMVDRRLMPPNDRKVWAFVGDGEMDEPESMAGLTLAARENLDNLCIVVNCNLQRLDGPVRGNGSIVQELERLFAGAGWNVCKVLWGTDWDGLFARDKSNVILRRLGETIDGELQSYAVHDGTYNRERFFNKYSELRDLVAQVSDTQIDQLTRGGHDYGKIYQAFRAATEHKGQPTVILALTKKGYGLGRWAEGKMSAHQQKKLDTEALHSFRDRFALPLSNEDVEQARFYRPPADSPELIYLHECRRRLGGYIPARARQAPRLNAPSRTVFAGFALEQEEREMSTTMAFARALNSLLKDPALGPRIVPIVSDEARTFGMEALFRTIGIYSHCGQLYEPADQENYLYYRESKDGQILEEGITEAGALSSWIAAGTAYTHHSIPMVPFFIYYSIFGFQRVGDLIWAAADSRARGFLLGATAGRTTLSGEGLQHQDGTSHLVASTVPNCRAYDPCFAYEVAVILEHGLKVTLGKQEDAFFYMTLMNENYVHPTMPQGAEEGIIKGMHLVRPSVLAAASASATVASAKYAHFRRPGRPMVGPGLSPEPVPHRSQDVGPGLSPERSALKGGPTTTELSPPNSTGADSHGVGPGLSPDRSHEVALGLSPERSALKGGPTTTELSPPSSTGADSHGVGPGLSPDRVPHHSEDVDPGFNPERIVPKNGGTVIEFSKPNTRDSISRPSRESTGKKRGPANGTRPKLLPRVQLLGSGTILREALAAAELLEKDWNIAADVWSVTSFTELRRQGMELERWNRLNPTEPPQASWVEKCLGPTAGPVIAATDYVRAVPDLIRAWIPRRYVTLGTDGFGRSDKRQSLRRFFEVDRLSIALAAIKALADEGIILRGLVAQFMARYDYHPNPVPPWAIDTTPHD